jgi:uncharacterized protein HemX
MGIETGTALLIASAIGAGTAAYTANKQEKAQEAATEQATKNAKATAKAAEEASNKANKKAPDSGALLSANIAGGKSGQASTMLTGATGIDPSVLQLGKTTLLGGGS